MTRDLAALYQETILEHGHHPRRTGPLASATHQASLDNPLCGDRITIRLRIEDDLDRRRQVRGARLLHRPGRGLAVGRGGRRTHRLGAAVARGRSPRSDGDAGIESADLGPLEVLGAARAFPARVACVTLAPKAALRALGER